MNHILMLGSSNDTEETLQNVALSLGILLFRKIIDPAPL